MNNFLTRIFLFWYFNYTITSLIDDRHSSKFSKHEWIQEIRNNDLVSLPHGWFRSQTESSLPDSYQTETRTRYTSCTYGNVSSAEVHINVVHQRCQRATSEIVFKQRVTLSPERIIMGNVKQFTLCGTFRNTFYKHIYNASDRYFNSSIKSSHLFYSYKNIPDTFTYIYIYTCFSYINLH